MSGFTIAPQQEADKNESEPPFYKSPAFKMFANVVLFTVSTMLY